MSYLLYHGFTQVMNPQHLPKQAFYSCSNHESIPKILINDSIADCYNGAD